METQLLDAIRILLRQELKPLNARLNTLELEMVNLKAEMQAGFRRIDSEHIEQNEKIDAMLEAWTIQKVHREELDDHEARITATEHRIPAIS
jgi:hypothetical protein